VQYHAVHGVDTRRHLRATVHRSGFLRLTPEEDVNIDDTVTTSMSADDLGIGLVGACFISRDAHAPSVEYSLDADIAGIQNRTRKNAETLADECHNRSGPRLSVYGEDDIAGLVADSDVDGVWITTPNFTLVDAVEDGADLQGVVIGKPIARTVEEGHRLIDLANRTDLPHAYL
jgi:predicted dehydrogenase